MRYRGEDNQVGGKMFLADTHAQSNKESRFAPRPNTASFFGEAEPIEPAVGTKGERQKRQKGCGLETLARARGR